VSHSTPLVRMQVPPTDDSVVIVRSTGALLGTQLGFTLERVQDLRMVVDELMSLMIGSRVTDDQVTAEFFVNDVELRVIVSGHTVEDSPPFGEGFAWTVLTALAESVDVDRPDGRLVITACMSLDPAELSAAE
jgi:serine/threonine-protein kinase RsbW